MKLLTLRIRPYCTLSWDSTIRPTEQDEQQNKRTQWKGTLGQKFFSARVVDLWNELVDGLVRDVKFRELLSSENFIEIFQWNFQRKFPKFHTIQGRTGFKNRPGQLSRWPYTLLAQPGQNHKKFRNHFCPCKNHRFFTSTLPAHRALPKCKHGQSAPDTI